MFLLNTVTCEKSSLDIRAGRQNIQPNEIWFNAWIVDKTTIDVLIIKSGEFDD